tara:strand:- start:3676 stop:4413 length:738 start_codon:yes stop_codon:yes gene_type:complete
MKLLAADSQPHRTPWGDTSAVAILASETLTKHHEHYAAAKSGDIAAGMAMVRDLINRRGVKRKIGMLIKRRDPLIVPVHAVESNSVNVIPTALAETLYGDFDLRVNYDILQANRVSHTGSDGYHRLATPPLFAGDVIRGENYLIIDDFVGQGQYPGSHRGERRQCHWYGVADGQKRSATIAVTVNTLKALRAKHETLEDWWREVFGYGFELLTESEARYLLNSPDVDNIRTRIAEIAREGDRRPG